LKRTYLECIANAARVSREASMLFEHLREASRVLELGCGLGLHGLELAKRGLLVLQTDLADERAEEARSLPFKRVDLLNESDFEGLGPFDAAYAVQVLCLFDLEKLGRVFKNVAKALRPGGLFVFDHEYEYEGLPEIVSCNGKKIRVTNRSVSRVGEGLRSRALEVVVDESGNALAEEEVVVYLYRPSLVDELLKSAGFAVEKRIPIKYIEDGGMEYSSPSERHGDLVVARLRL